ncbi:hypothetical protein BDF20DRAFT_971839, partial [Mycotypha africana]|uniref:uncharacterized protein n=1 Tax=Mycotypha africana TaxID=64632 RepID=UPI0023014573
MINDNSTFKLKHNYLDAAELTDGEEELFNKLIDFEPNTSDDGPTATLSVSIPKLEGAAKDKDDHEENDSAESDSASPRRQGSSPVPPPEHPYLPNGGIDRHDGVQRKKKSGKYRHITFLEPNIDLLGEERASQLETQQQQQLYELNRRFVLDHSAQQSHYRLEVVEQPQQCRVSRYGEKDRRPIDPAPIVKLDISSK